MIPFLLTALFAWFTAVASQCAFAACSLLLLKGSTGIPNLFVSNLWITQRLVAKPVDKSVDNLWISLKRSVKTIAYPVDNFWWRK